MVDQRFGEEIDHSSQSSQENCRSQPFPSRQDELTALAVIKKTIPFLNTAKTIDRTENNSNNQ